MTILLGGFIARVSKEDSSNQQLGVRRWITNDNV
jgi:hypothetical protein